MCGIIGYLGERNAAPILIEGLRRLEYRGYDSAGLALLNGQGLLVRKAQGKIEQLVKRLELDSLFAGRKAQIGVGHTRWATHGPPSEVNAHPHIDCHGTIALVHNGIVENFQELRESLAAKGHRIRSQTDTEVLAHLVEQEYRGDLLEAVRRALEKVRGTYAIAVISQREPRRLVAARRGSPLVIGLGKEEYFVASDVTALMEHTKRVIYMEDDEIVDVGAEGFELTNHKKEAIFRTPSVIEWDLSQARKEGYPHFMLKEIMEQPESLRRTMANRIQSEGGVNFEELASLREFLTKGMNRIVILGCGTAYHAGLVGGYLLQKLLGLPVEVEMSSEFRYSSPAMTNETLVIAISQSGETADTLASARHAKKHEGRVLAICNVVGSSLTREVDGNVYIHAGPEIAVASTKAYTSQLAALYLLALYTARLRNTITAREEKELASFLREIPEQIQKVLKLSDSIRELAKKYSRFDRFLYLGRHLNFPSALEGALKLKEISYIHAEGYPAGEMKHGHIALIDENMPVACIATKSSVYEKMSSNIQEVHARAGKILAIVSEGDTEVRPLAEDAIEIPAVHEFVSPIIVAVAMQLFAYHVAVERGLDVDQPRNLAKSVTVE